ncbi:MAG TPA: hypothetical protein VLH56_19440 [Dissulfurispiraceae bacterium]|nr:hypothetical protein [Dissulfurispiraceae bacterium]
MAELTCEQAITWLRSRAEGIIAMVTLAQDLRREHGPDTPQNEVDDHNAMLPALYLLGWALALEGGADCRACGGTGLAWDDVSCPDCGGTGLSAEMQTALQQCEPKGSDYGSN